MPERNCELLLQQIADEEDITFLSEAAAQLGIPIEQLTKETIEKHITDRTRPKTMTGTVQSFRRPYSPSRNRTDEGLKSE
ncbi:hypothetical protein [Pseudomonas sp. RGM2987]|uniref:hypothetical protein n=1 Tax=Pseudomonas sp. RGM2987 TaxID=2930090 RepID=UPI001FD6873D|nr:hypothetical protein [Pseudomonas sp. RGM2987]MCJ8207705.1 hypothetical protein [Pseudomonas sp. RGM2987]